MTNPRPPEELKNHWQTFVRAIRTLFVGLPEHRHEDQFLRVKEAALTLAESQKMADEIEAAYRNAVLGDSNESTVAADAVEIVVMELEAFPIAVGVHEDEQKAGTAKPGARKRLRSACKTILGSVGDLFKLTTFGKGVITVSKEALDLCGGE
jgi:hypothetical protein